MYYNNSPAPPQQGSGSEDNRRWYECPDPSDENEAEINSPPPLPSRIDPTLEATLLPHMPSLFTKTLPPCGLEIQVAYENVVARLRSLWLKSAAKDLSNVSTLDLCREVNNTLDQENTENPTLALHRTKPRTPWRRESVFRQELRWTGYFVREAEAMAGWSEMSEAQRLKHEFANGLYVVPRELYISVRGLKNHREVLRMWEAWNEEKRGDWTRAKERVGWSVMGGVEGHGGSAHVTDGGVSGVGESVGTAESDEAKDSFEQVSIRNAAEGTAQQELNQLDEETAESDPLTNCQM